MKFTIEGRQTVLDVIEANDRMEAIKKFHARYPAVNEIVKVKEGVNPGVDSDEPKGHLYNPEWDRR